MATEKKVSEKAVESEKVEIDKAQLDSILAQQEEMKATIALLTKNAGDDTKKLEAADKLKAEESKLLELVEKANKEAEELVETHIDLGSLKSNKNLELNINGVQSIIPKGQTVKIPKKAKEIIDNAKKQQAIALGIQEKRAEEAAKAIAEEKI